MRFPILGGLLPIRARSAGRDALAGLTLASMNIPQVLGYTKIAGTPVVTGLYTVLLPLVGFAVFGSSRHLVVAADSATAAIFSSALSRMAPLASEKYMTLVGMLTLLIAGLLLVARIFRLGFLADFLSRTALVGFLTGVGVQVGIAMLGDMLGVPVRSERTLLQLDDVLTGLAQVNTLTLGLSILVVAAIFLGRWLAPRFPVPLVVVVGMIAASAWYHLAERGVAVVGPVPGGLPSLRWPDVTWHETLSLLPVAVSCFVMIIAQSAATSRVYALRHKERVDENADILGLAAANAGAAVSGAFVVNGSPTQTAMADRSGARSQFAQLFFAGIGGRAFVPDEAVTIFAALRVGEHRVHDCGRHDRRERAQCDPQGKPQRISHRARHRCGCSGHRRRGGHPPRDRAVAHRPCQAQLSSAHDGARADYDWPLCADPG